MRKRDNYVDLNIDNVRHVFSAWDVRATKHKYYNLSPYIA